MFAFKKKYFLLIENTKNINIKNIKKYNKFIIIYRNLNIKESLYDLKRFRKRRKLKSIKFYVANDIKLAISLNSDGIYLSSYNKTFKALFLKKLNYKIIGSAHNISEIYSKFNQGCSYILFSKLFKVDYTKHSPYLGIVKFNKFINSISKNLIPLGGIKASNLSSLKNINSKGFAIMSEIKKKPAISNRLF